MNPVINNIVIACPDGGVSITAHAQKQSASKAATFDHGGTVVCPDGALFVAPGTALESLVGHAVEADALSRYGRGRRLQETCRPVPARDCCSHEHRVPAQDGSSERPSLPIRVSAPHRRERAGTAPRCGALEAALRRAEPI